MNIQKIQVEGFGKLLGETLSFSPGLNVVIGGNEAGKTTVVECLAAVSYGLRQKKGEKERWRPWKGRTYAAKMVLKLADSSVVTIRRDFDTARADYLHVDSTGRTLEELTELKATPGGRTAEARAFADKVQALFGIGSDQAFRQSICVSYQDLAELVGNPLSVLLRQAVTGARVNYEQVTEELRAHLNDITREFMSGRPSDKKLEKLKARYTQLQEKLEALESDYRQLERLRLQIAGLNREIASLKTQSAGLEDTLEKVDAYRKCDEEITRWTDKREYVSKQCATLEKIGGKRTELDSYEDVQALPDDFEGRLTQAKHMQEEVTRLQRENQERQELVRAMHIMPIWHRPAFLALFLSSLVIAGVVSIWFWQLGIVLVLAIGLGLGVAILQSMTQASARRAANRQLEATQSQLGEAQQQLDSTLGELGGFLPGFSLEQADQTLARWKESLQITHDIELLTGQVEGGLALPAVRQQLKEAEDKLATISLEKKKRESEAGYLKVLTPDFEINKKTDLESAQRKLEESQNKLEETSREEAALSARVGNLEQLQEDIDQVASTVRCYEFLRDAHKVALETWQESIAEFHQDYMPHFANVVSRHFQTITAGRYSQMTFDDQLSPIVRGPEAEKIKEEYLSQGTKDELFFAIRLALVELFSRQQEPLPLVLDDPFLTFDADRRQHALSAIHRIAETTQVIILTLDESLRNCKGKVLDLTS